ncbi:hypothetical protein RYX36_012871 [Vicia faba]
MVIVSFSLFISQCVPQYFNEYLALSRHGTVTGSSSFNNIVQVIFSSPATVEIMLCKIDKSELLLFEEHLDTNLVGGICKQAVEKLDKLRVVASSFLYKIVYNQMIYIPYIPFREKLEEIIPKEAGAKWVVSLQIFHPFLRSVELEKFLCVELSATNDIEAFKTEVEQKGYDLNEAGFWYCRKIVSKKMCYEKRTPLMVASLFGSTRVVKYIIDTNMVDVNTQTGRENVTALHCVVGGGSESTLEVVKLLIDDGADVNSLDEMIKHKISVSNSKELLGSEKKEYPIDISLRDINNGIFGTDEFRMYSFKVKTCSRGYSHDWTHCPFVHPCENARRRDPKKYLYSCVSCPEFRKETCHNKDACEYSHGVFESFLCSLQYSTRLCKDEIRCSRKVCFFAHKHEELRPLYASTGSTMPSKESLPTSNVSTPLMFPLIAASTPNSVTLWQNEISLTQPSL